MAQTQIAPLAPLVPSIDCRVRKANRCRLVSAGKAECGGKTYAVGGTLQHIYGGTLYDPDRGLRIAQRRDFLTPYFFDGGCMERYCTNRRQCPSAQIAKPSLETTRMLDFAFASADPYASVAAVPGPCAGVKCDGYNSAAGWRTACVQRDAGGPCERVGVAWQAE